MKKNIEIISVLTLMLLITSCAKEYTCDCTEYNSYTNEVINSYSKSGKMTNDKVEDWCKSESYRFASVVKCNIK